MQHPNHVGRFTNCAWALRRNRMLAEVAEKYRSAPIKLSRGEGQRQRALHTKNSSTPMPIEVHRRGLLEGAMKARHFSFRALISRLHRFSRPAPGWTPRANSGAGFQEQFGSPRCNKVVMAGPDPRTRYLPSACRWGDKSMAGGDRFAQAGRPNKWPCRRSKSCSRLRKSHQILKLCP